MDVCTKKNQLSIIIVSIYVLAFYHEWRSLIGYATHYLSILL